MLYEDHMAKVFATPRLRKVLSNMEQVVEGKSGRRKMSIISGHDSNVLPILTFLNLTNADCVQKKFRNQTVTGNCADIVPFASNVQIELHIKDS